MYKAGMVFLPPRGGFAFRHFSGAKLRKISETTPPFNDRNIFFAFKTKKNRKNIWRFHGKYVPLHSQSSKCFNSSVG